MKYFLHDTSAFQDEKISQLFIKFGYEGIGLFFTLLEKIALQEKPVNSLVLKKQLFIGKKLEKCWNFMEEIDLISTKNGETFNENLLKFSEKYKIKKEKTREKVSQWRDKQKDKKNVTGYVPDCNPPKVKESKVKESKVKENNIEFDLFWNSYHEISKLPKTDMQAALKHWTKLKESEKQKAIDNIQAYCDSISEKKYIKKARTYLSDRNFNDEFGPKEIVFTGNFDDYIYPGVARSFLSDEQLIDGIKKGLYKRKPGPPSKNLFGY